MGCYVVALDESSIIVGFICAFKTDPQSVHIEQTSVAPNSLRQGVGYSLLSVLLTEARQRGVTKLALTTNAANPWSQSLYRKIGFVEVTAGSDLPNFTRNALNHEIAAGLENRIAMVIKIAPSSPQKSGDKVSEHLD